MTTTTTHSACSCAGTCRQAATLVATVEAIRKRQMAKLCGHLRSTGQATQRLEADVCRAMNFAFSDVTEAIRNHEKSMEKPHASRIH